MNSDDILRDLYYGRITPWEEPAEDGDEVDKIKSNLSDMHETIIEKLDPKTKAEFDAYLSERSRLEDIDLTQAFKSGFKLGAKIAFAIYKR